jgi:hypothetical protein
MSSRSLGGGRHATKPVPVLHRTGEDASARGHIARLRSARGSVKHRSSAAGAVCSQFSQAGASLVLSVAGVRYLTTASWGVLSLLLGSLVLATALMTGFVGDSLTVLDRADRSVRTALQIWCVVIMSGLLVVGAFATAVPGLLDRTEAVMFGLALAAFTMEDCARRLLMANLRFWSVVAVDLFALSVSVVVLVTEHAQHGRIVLSDFLLAVVLGQVLATGLGIVLLPSTERWLAAARTPAMMAVARFGGWRALQQGLRPTALTVTRLMVVAAASRAALGELEAARVYMSPTLLVVQGFGSYLLVSYAADRHLGRREAVRAADWATAILTGSSVVLGVVAVLALPLLGGVLTGGATHVDVVAAAGWALFAASAAATMPYTSLAAVRGRQPIVVGLRVVDTVASLVFVAVLLFVVRSSPSITPYGLALGAFVGAGLQRWIGLAPQRVSSGSQQPVSVGGALRADRST